MRHAVVCGAGGFIASHLVKRLKHEGYWVRGVDVKKPEFAPTAADEFLLLDLRDLEQARRAVRPANGDRIAEVYQLTAEMGGMGFTSTLSGKRLRVQYVPGPIGVQSRNFSNARINSLGWRPKTSLRDGLGITYGWIDQQMRRR